MQSHPEEDRRVHQDRVTMHARSRSSSPRGAEMARYAREGAAGKHLGRKAQATQLLPGHRKGGRLSVLGTSGQPPRPLSPRRRAACKCTLGEVFPKPPTNWKTPDVPWPPQTGPSWPRRFLDPPMSEDYRKVLLPSCLDLFLSSPQG